MKKRKKRGRKAAGAKKTKGALKKKRVVRRKRAARKAVAPATPAPAPAPKPPYVAPRRTDVKAAVCALLPHVDPKLIKRLDYWALYTIHQDVVKDGKDAEALARKLIRGYDPSKALPIQAQAPDAPPVTAEAAAKMTAKEQERMMRAKELENRKMDAKKRELAARERARVAKELARAKAQAAKARERAARDAARAKRLGAAKPAAPAARPAAPAAGKPSTPAVPAKSVRVPAGTYIAPVRVRIREELVKVMPMIKQSDLTGLDYWALYTMHSRICKYGDDPESMARKFVKGYKRVKK